MNWQIELYLLWKIGCINPIFFIAKNFNTLKHKSIVFLCIQYTKPNISKPMNWKYMVALTFDLSVF